MKMQTTNKMLNLDNIIKQKLKLNIYDKDIAEELNVSVAKVSAWFANEQFPDLPHLLRLGVMLCLKREELVIDEPTNEELPIIHFIH